MVWEIRRTNETPFYGLPASQPLIPFEDFNFRSRFSAVSSISPRSNLIALDSSSRTVSINAELLRQWPASRKSPPPVAAFGDEIG
jgi:hypothetical protein